MPDNPIVANGEYVYEGKAEVSFKFVVPGHAILRVLENWDSNGDPQPDERGGTGWRNTMYGLDDEEAVVRMLVWNLCLQDRALDQLDGWADIEDPEKARNQFARRYVGEVELDSLWDFARKNFGVEAS
jgi:hypothetical protein